MEKIKNMYDKFKLKHPKVDRLINLLIVLLVLLLTIEITYLYNLLGPFKISTELIASLVGATIGGIITYYTTTHSVLKTNQVKSSIVNKKTIYEPILKELQDLLIEFEKNEDTGGNLYKKHKWYNLNLLEAWTRIKNDTRVFQIPNYLKYDLIKMEEELVNYFVYMDEATQSASDYFVELLRERGYEIKENDFHMGHFFGVDETVNKKTNLALEIFNDNISGVPEVENEDQQAINEIFNEYILNNDKVDILKNKRQITIESIEDCKEVVELIIITIINKYERQNNIF
ncbi:hypothetical protein ABES25_06135 [Bacillus gobiensis]|uniref:hypothetical protein n=1 Tax=Bacillus gobiensis TaxID=1441095 RepID=UPI003D258A5C